MASSRKRVAIEYILENLELVVEGNTLVSDPTPTDYRFQSNFKGRVKRGSGFIPDTSDELEVWLSAPGEVRDYGHGAGQSHGIVDVSIILMSRALDIRDTFDKAIQDIRYLIDSPQVQNSLHRIHITKLDIDEILFSPVGVTETGIAEIKLELVYILA